MIMLVTFTEAAATASTSSLISFSLSSPPKFHHKSRIYGCKATFGLRTKPTSWIAAASLSSSTTTTSRSLIANYLQFFDLNIVELSISGSWMLAILFFETFGLVGSISLFG